MKASLDTESEKCREETSPQTTSTRISVLDWWERRASPSSPLAHSMIRLLVRLWAMLFYPTGHQFLAPILTFRSALTSTYPSGNNSLMSDTLELKAFHAVQLFSRQPCIWPPMNSSVSVDWVGAAPTQSKKRTSARKPTN